MAEPRSDPAPAAQAGAVRVSRVRVAIAGVTGLYYRLARRIGLRTRATRQAERQASRPLVAPPALTAVGPVDEQPVRVLLVGNGPAESPGVGAGEDGFGALIARALHERTDRAVTVRTVLGGGWDLSSLADTLRDEQLHWSDVLIVSAGYRPQLAEVPLDQWRDYADRLRALLIAETEPGSVIRVLSLPWRDAVRRAPGEWGGTFGNRVLVMAELAESTLHPDQPATSLLLRPPFDADEWDGPEFTPRTYLAWADQVAADIAAHLPDARS